MCLNKINRIELGAKLAKYDPLYEYLKSRKLEHWRPSMTEIETVLGFPLPSSAKRYPAWWANQRGAAVQANSWLDAGWETSNVVPGGKVTFKRVNLGGMVSKPAGGIRPVAKASTPSASARFPAAAPSTVALDPYDGDATESYAPTDWFWEGHVVEAVERHLTEMGWLIVGKADTASKQRGIDLHVERHGVQLLIEAKGYPSKGYRDPVRAHEMKPTTQTAQALHWFSQALLKAMRLQNKYPNSKIALAFPDFPRYRALVSETERALTKLGIAILFASENGKVRATGL